MFDFSSENFMDFSLKIDKEKSAKFEILGSFKFYLGRSGC